VQNRNDINHVPDHAMDHDVGKRGDDHQPFPFTLGRPDIGKINSRLIERSMRLTTAPAATRSNCEM
jgi:hypothetical protein